MKISSLLDFSDNTFELLEKIENIEKYYIDKNLKIVSATLELHDPRQITHQQRKFIYALIYDISMHINGYCDEMLKAYYKSYFKQQLIDLDIIDESYSLSNCSMTYANLLIAIILETVFQYRIPLRYETLKELEDIEAWQYMCIKYKRCCVCGKDGEIHHYNAIGLGHDRKKVDDSKHLKMALCRSHHQEIHSMSRDEFCKKYHVKPIIYKE